MASRSGSEKRQRTSVFTMRFKPDEAAAIRRLAQQRGVSVAELVRTNVLRVRARPSRVDLSALAQVRHALGSLTGAVNKIGGNVNQAVYRMNISPDNTSAVRLGQAIEGYLHELKGLLDRDMAELRIVCLQAMGKEPRREKFSDED